MHMTTQNCGDGALAVVIINPGMLEWRSARLHDVEHSTLLFYISSVTATHKPSIPSANSILTITRLIHYHTPHFRHHITNN